MGHYNVGVVGASVHGASAARHLAGHGVRVVVYERKVPAGGPTGVSSTVCRGYYTNPFLARIAAEKLRMFGDFSTLTEGPVMGRGHVGRRPGKPVRRELGLAAGDRRGAGGRARFRDCRNERTRFKLAPALGDQIARLVLNDDPHPDLAQFHPDQAGLLASGYGAARIIG